jgi:hypothetical protein
MPGIAYKSNTTCLYRWSLLSALLLLLPFQGLPADEELERQVLVGLKIFPAVLAASPALDQKPAMSTIRVLILYRDDRGYAEKLAGILREIDRIREIPLRVETAPVSALQQQSDAPPFAVFVCQRNEEDVAQISDYGRQNGIITFSPFRGDVEKGILAGIAISDRILPFINNETLAKLPFGLKAFFLRVAEIYEP